MGRPPKAPEDKSSERVMVRFTPGQYRKLLAEAKKAGLPLAAFIVKRLEG